MQVEAARAADEPIAVTLPDGKEVPGVRGVTTPLDVANQLSKSLAKKVVVAKVDGHEWDLFRPLQAACKLQLLTFDDDLGKHVRRPGLTSRTLALQTLALFGPSKLMTSTNVWVVRVALAWWGALSFPQVCRGYCRSRS